jgi:N,N'-diacetyllegionaminate synthase
VKIGNCDLAERTFIVAEAGANHEGDIKVARELVERAAETGVDAVKFQTYQAEKIAASSEKERIEHFRRLALKEEDFLELAALAREEGLLFLSTPFYLEAVDLLDPLVPAFKIASGDITYSQLIEYIAKKDKPILLSTGMSYAEDIWQAIEIVKKANNRIIEEKRLVLLHCVSSYPTEIEQANLGAIPFMRETFRLPIGYSDHTLGLQACLSAVALGACLIEKHFTLDKSRQGFRDHQLSADVKDMTELVQKVRLVEKSLGEGGKEPLECELGNQKSMRRSLSASRDIYQGSIIAEDMLMALRPEIGIPANQWRQVIGKRSRRNIVKGEIIFSQDVEGL